LRYGNADTHSSYYTYPNSDSYTDGNRNANCYSCDPDRDANGNTDRDSYSYPYTDANAYSDCHANTNPHTFPANSYCGNKRHR